MSAQLHFFQIELIQLHTVLSESLAILAAQLRADSATFTIVTNKVTDIDSRTLTTDCKHWYGQNKENGLYIYQRKYFVP